MTEDARAEGRQEGLQEGLEQGREEEHRVAQEIMLKQLCEMLMEIVTGRFPNFVRLAKLMVRDVKGIERLKSVIVKVSLAREDDDIEQYLWKLDEEEDGEQVAQ